MNMGPMDAHRWEEQNRLEQNEASYKLGLERARTGESLLASATGQATVQGQLDRLRGLARGGPAESRRPYLVGEKGPELMVPDQDGTIIPNHKLKTLAKALLKRKRVVPRAEGGGVKQGGAPAPRPHQQEAQAAVAAGPQAVAAYHDRTDAIVPGSADRSLAAPAPAARVDPGPAPERTQAYRQEAPAYQPQPQNLRQAAGPQGGGQIIDTGYIEYRKPGGAGGVYGPEGGGTDTTPGGLALGLRPTPPVYGGGDTEKSTNRFYKLENAAPLSQQDLTQLYHQDTQARYDREKAQYKVDLDRYNSGAWREPAPAGPLTQRDPGSNQGWKTEANPTGRMPDVRRVGGVTPDGLATTNYVDYNQLPVMGRPETQHNPAGPYSQHSRNKRAGQIGDYRDKNWLREAHPDVRLQDVVPRAKGGAVKAGGASEDDGGLDTVNKNWSGPAKAAAEREAGLRAGEASLGSPESYGGGRRVVQPQIPEGGLSTDAGGYDPSKPSFSNPIPIIRRMGQTYQGPESGQEYRSLAQANQAFIRAGQGTVPQEGQRQVQSLAGAALTAPGRPGYGIDGQPIIMGYDPGDTDKFAGGPRLRETARLHEQDPAVQALADERSAFAEQRRGKAAQDELANSAKISETHLASFDRHVDETLGTYDKDTGKKKFKASSEGQAADVMAGKVVAQQLGSEKGKAYLSERQAAREFVMKRMPEVKDVTGWLNGMSQDPESWARVRKAAEAAQPRMTTPPAAAKAPNPLALQNIIGRRLSAGASNEFYP
jgi:hypothetical protein